MKFKPVTQKYNFDKHLLFLDYPDYLHTSISTFIRAVLHEANFLDEEGYVGNESYVLKELFLNNIEIIFREKFPSDLNYLIEFIFSDHDRTTNFLAFCLQNYAKSTQANYLENALSVGGSGYKVMFTVNNPESYKTGVATLVERVPEYVQLAAESVLSNESLIKEAWLSCYSQNPDYSKTVSKCVDALEGLFKKKYFPDNLKPNLTSFLNDFKNLPSKLIYKGDNLPVSKNDLTELAREFIPIRGHHTSGTGRIATKDEAEFVLHYTVFVFSVH